MGRGGLILFFLFLTLTHLIPLFCYYTFVNIRKRLGFWCFQGVLKETSGMKQVNQKKKKKKKNELTNPLVNKWVILLILPFVVISCAASVVLRFHWKSFFFEHCHLKKTPSLPELLPQRNRVLGMVSNVHF